MKISVIIPAYQASRTIGRTLDSVLAQTRPADEVVVCDDGSTDDTAEVVGTYPSVRLVRQVNKGVSAASNSAYRASTGNMIVRLDADDTWERERLEAMEQVLEERSDIDLVTTDAIVHESDCTYRYYAARPFPVGDRQRVAILERNFVFGSVAMRRSALDRVAGWSEDVPRQGEYELWVRLILSGSRVALVDRPLAHYYRQPSGLGWGYVGIRGLMIYTLRTAIHDFDLTAEERSVALRRIAELQSQDAISEAVRRIRTGSPRARHAAVAALCRPNVSTSLRMKMLIGVASPVVARRLILKRQGPADPRQNA